jgi:hypothetical protein
METRFLQDLEKPIRSLIPNFPRGYTIIAGSFFDFSMTMHIA